MFADKLLVNGYNLFVPLPIGEIVSAPTASEVPFWLLAVFISGILCVSAGPYLAPVGSGEKDQDSL